MAKVPEIRVSQLQTHDAYDPVEVHNYSVIEKTWVNEGEQLQYQYGEWFFEKHYKNVLQRISFVVTDIKS